jgi:hypothetical protein
VPLKFNGNDVNSIPLVLHDLFAASINRACQAIDWDYGEIWIPNQAETLLEISPVWYGNCNRSSTRLNELEKFKACSEKFVVSINEGLPGRILGSHQIEWINDVSIQSENYFIRNQIAKAFNIKAGFGFPVICDREMIGIFVFFVDRACKEDRDLVQLAISAATPLRV